MAGIEGLVRALHEGDEAAKTAAARALGTLAYEDPANHLLTPLDKRTVLIIIPPLVELLRDGSEEAQLYSVCALHYLACDNDHDSHAAAIAEAGGIAPLVELLRDSVCEFVEMWVAEVLNGIAHNNDTNMLAIALACGFEALVQLARRGRVTVDNQSVVYDAGVPAKRKAALVVAALLGDCVPDSVPREIKTVIGSYL